MNNRNVPINIQLNIPVTSAFGKRFLFMREVATVVSAVLILNKWGKNVRGINR